MSVAAVELTPPAACWLFFPLFHASPPPSPPPPFLPDVGGGIAFASRTSGGSRSRLQTHPHWNLWLELYALIQDGVHFTDPAHRRRSREAGGLDARLVVSSNRNHHASGKSSKKPSKKDRKKKATHALQDAPSSTDGVLVSEPAARQWAPTRTGLLAVGARETGVKVELG